MNTYPKLFEPLPLGRGNKVLNNRIAMGPMTLNQATADGHITDWIVEWYERRAQGGCGTLIGAAAFVSKNGRGWPNAMGICDDSYTEGWARCAAAAHKYGSLFGTQIFHAGAASSRALLGEQPVSASNWTRKGFDPARALTSGEIDQIIDDFAQAARRSVEAGCDFVEIHGAHGYLVHQFWRGDVNLRTDEWGGSSEKRTHFPAAVVRAVRKAVSDEVPIFYRFSIHADAPDSPNVPITPDDLRIFLNAIEGAGADVWDISCWHESRRGYFGTEIWLPDWVAKFSEKPRLVAGNLMTPEGAEEYLEAGHAECAVLARALIADARWAQKAREGRSGDIRRYEENHRNLINSGTDPGAQP